MIQSEYFFAELTGVCELVALFVDEADDDVADEAASVCGKKAACAVDEMVDAWPAAMRRPSALRHCA